MLRTFAIFVGLVTLLGAGIAVAAWPRAHAVPETVVASLRVFDEAYARIQPGQPVSALAGLGFDIAAPGTEKLSSLGVMERFMPAAAADVDAMDPALQACLSADGRCRAYVFPVRLGRDADASRLRVTVLVDGGRIAWKSVSGRTESLAARRWRRLASR